MGFTIVASRFLFGTLKATRKMAKDTRELGEAQVRGYIKFDILNVTIEPIKNAEGGNIFFKVVLKLINVGQTPVSSIVLLYDIMDCGHGEQLTYSLTESGERLPSTHSFLAVGGQSITTLTRIWQVNDPLDIVNAKGRLVRLIFSAQYIDAFGVECGTHTTSGTFKIEGDDIAFIPDSAQ